VIGTGKFSVAVATPQICDGNGANCRQVNQLLTGVSNGSLKIAKLDG